jgi:hypothetical protein
LNYLHVAIRDKEKHWSARMRSLHYRRPVPERLPFIWSNSCYTCVNRRIKIIKFEYFSF